MLKIHLFRFFIWS